MPTPAAGSVPTSNRSMRVRGSPKLGHDFCLLQIGILLINRQTAGISIRSLVASSRASSPAARPPAVVDSQAPGEEKTSAAAAAAASGSPDFIASR